MLQGVNEEGLRWDFTKGSLEGLQTDDELTSHLAGRTVQCGVDQTKNPTVNSPHLIHSTRRRVDFWATINIAMWPNARSSGRRSLADTRVIYRRLSPAGYYNQPLAANGNRREGTASK